MNQFQRIALDYWDRPHNHRGVRYFFAAAPISHDQPHWTDSILRSCHEIQLYPVEINKWWRFKQFEAHDTHTKMLFDPGCTVLLCDSPELSLSHADYYQWYLGEAGPKSLAPSPLLFRSFTDSSLLFRAMFGNINSGANTKYSVICQIYRFTQWHMTVSVKSTCVHAFVCMCVWGCVPLLLDYWLLLPIE